MEMSAEVRYKLDLFKPRDYQIPLINAVEKEGYKKVLALWCRRCLHGDSHILMADGSYKLLKNINKGDQVLSWNGNGYEPDTVKDIWKTEKKETFLVHAKCCLPIEVSEDHKFLAGSKDRKFKWIKAYELKKNKQLSSYAGMPCGILHDPDLAEFLGYMLSDGYVSRYQQPKFTNNNLEILDRVKYLAKKLFNYDCVVRPKGNGFDLGFTNGTLGGGKTPNKIKQLFRDYGVDVPKKKRPLHPLAYQFDEESLGRLFAALLSADGSIYITKSRKLYDKKRDRTSFTKPNVEITISCGKSEEYGWGIYWLLRKLSIIPQMPYFERGANFKIKICHTYQVRKLLSYGPIYGKIDKQDLALSTIKDSQETFCKIYDGCYRNRFKGMRPYRKDILYDLETERNHNFIANGFIVHNSGKDITAWNLIIRAALRQVGVYFYCLPTYKQARLVIFDSITNEGKRFINYIPEPLITKINSQEMKITLINGSLIQCIGSDTYDTSLIGTNPRMIVFSEMALSDERAYQYIRPIMNNNNGQVIILSTPRGHNHFYTLYEIARNSQDWFCYKLTVDDCGHIPLELIQKDIQSGEMSEDMAQAEYWCDFSSGVEGSYYGKYIDRMRLNNQITTVPWEPGFSVHSSWDIGIRDSTSIIMFQVIGTTVRIIDCYQKNKEGLEHYINVLKSKPYTWGRHIAPHDIGVTEFSSGQTRIAKAKQLGINFTLATNVSIMDGIESCRSNFARCWIDEVKCAPLIKALENYRQEYDSKRKVYMAKPLHNEYSHFCDSFRYLCVSLSKTRDGLTAEALDKRYQEAILKGSNNVPKPFRDEPW